MVLRAVRGSEGGPEGGPGGCPGPPEGGWEVGWEGGPRGGEGPSGPESGVSGDPGRFLAELSERQPNAVWGYGGDREVTELSVLPSFELKSVISDLTCSRISGPLGIPT